MAVEIGAAYLSIIPSAKDFASKLQGEIGPGMTKAGNDAGAKHGAGMLAGAKKFVAPLASLFAAKLGVDFFKSAIQGASDLNESQSKVGVVFKSSSGQVIEASKTAATAMGLSQNSYLAAAGTFGNLLVSLGLGPKAASGMSTQMVKLAGDLASFNNVSPEEALDAIRSGLTGETEPLKKFGVNMNDATLKAQALKMHLIKTTKDALTPQSKALAAQALIMGQTKTAQGDFTRTSGGLANQQRILAARTEDLKTKIGTGLLPITTSITTKFSAFVGGMQDGTGAGGKFRDILSTVGTALVSVGTFLKSHTGLVKAAAVVVGVLAAGVGTYNIAVGISSIATKVWTVATTIAKVATSGWTVVQWLLNAALIANPIGLVVAAVALLIAGIVLIATKTTWFQTIWQYMTSSLAAAWRWMWNSILAPIIRFVLKGFASIVDGIANMLRVLSNIPGFGWAKTAADKMAGAAEKARALADGIKDIPDNKVISVSVNGYAATYQQLKNIQATLRNVNGASVRIAMGSGGQGGVTAGNAMGTDNWRGGPTWVGERGPEIVNLPRGSQVIPNHKLGNGGGQPINLVVRIGDRELTDIIDVTVNGHEQRLVDALVYGGGS